MSQRSQRRHPASLLPTALHNPGLVYLMAQPVTVEMVIYVARQVGNVLGEDPYNADTLAQYHSMISLEHFMCGIVKGANLNTATFLTTLIYLERLRPKLHNSATGLPCTRHRIFLATLIVTAKYLNDSSPKNVHWAFHAFNMFQVSEVNIMEQQLLFLLNYDLRFQEDEACSAFSPFMRCSYPSTRVLPVSKVARGGRIRAHAQGQKQQRTAPPTPPYDPSSCSLSSSSSSSSNAPSTLVSTVRELAKRLSHSHLSSSFRANTDTLPVAARSYDSGSSYASSDMGSMVDDNGSSSSSSSGWLSDSDYESDTDRRVYYDAGSASAGSATELQAAEQVDDYAPVPTSSKRTFVLRPAPTYGYKGQHMQDRSRKPSDTSSVSTLTGASPQLSSLRRTSMAQPPMATSKRSSATTSSISISATMPSIGRTGASGSFLSRMWGAARGEKPSGLAESRSDGMPAHHGQSAFKRLVLVHSRSHFPGVGRGAPVADASLQV